MLVPFTSSYLKTLEVVISLSVALFLEYSHVHSDHLLLAVASASANGRWFGRTWLSSTYGANDLNIRGSGWELGWVTTGHSSLFITDKTRLSPARR